MVIYLPVGVLQTLLCRSLVDPLTQLQHWLLYFEEEIKPVVPCGFPGPGLQTIAYQGTVSKVRLTIHIPLCITASPSEVPRQAAVQLPSDQRLRAGRLPVGGPLLQ